MKSIYPTHLKIMSLTLVISFLSMDFSWASTLRERLKEDQMAWEMLQEGRRYSGFDISDGNVTSTVAFEEAAQSTVAQQNELADLENSNYYTLKTQNEDLIEYIGDTVNKITRPDGTILKNIQIANGQITDARIELSDGSYQLFQGGSVVEYTRPDGSVIRYEAGRIVSEAIPYDDGDPETEDNPIIIDYSETADGGTRSVNQMSGVIMLFDASGVLASIEKPKEGELIEFEQGIIKRVITSAGVVEYEQSEVDGQTVVTAMGSSSGGGPTTDQDGNEFIFESGEIVEVRMAGGEILRDLVWNEDDTLKSYGQKINTDGSTISYAYEGDAVAGIVASDASGAQVFSYQINPDGSKVVERGEGIWSYQNERLISYQSQAEGTLSYHYQSGELAEIHKDISDVTYIYNPDHKLIRTEDDLQIIEYKADGPFAGYAEIRHDLTAGISYHYAYTMQADGSVETIMSEVLDVDTSIHSESFYGTNYQDGLLSPEISGKFTFSNAVNNSPYIKIESYIYESGVQYQYNTLYIRKNQIEFVRNGYDYATGQSIYENEYPDFIPDPTGTYTVKLKYESEKIRYYLTDSAGAETLIHEEPDGSGNPRLSLSSQGTPLELISASDADTRQALQQTVNDLQKNFQYRNLIRFHEGNYSRSYDYDWYVNGKKITMDYNQSSGRFTFRCQYYDPDLRRTVTDFYETVDMQLETGVDYLSETVMTDQGIQLFVWDADSDQPVEPVITLSNYVSDTFTQIHWISGGQSEMIALGEQSAVQNPILANHLLLDDYRNEWVFDGTRLISLTTPDNGKVIYNYDNDVLTGYTKHKDGIVIEFDTQARPVSALDSDSSYTFHLNGPYAGRIKQEQELSSGILYTYEYAEQPDGTITAQKSSQIDIDLGYSSYTYGGSAYQSLESNPEIRVKFNHSESLPGTNGRADLTAYHYTSSVAYHSLSFNMYQSNIRLNYYSNDYVTGIYTSDYQTIQHQFDPETTYEAWVKFENGNANLYVMPEGGAQELVYSFEGADWAPRLSAASSYMPLEMLSHPESNHAIQQQGNAYDLDDMAVVSGDFIFDSGRLGNDQFQIRYYGTNNGKSERSEIYYNTYYKKFYQKLYQWNESTQSYGYVYGTAVPYTMSEDVKYRFESRIDGGQVKLFVWEDGQEKPADPVVVQESFDFDTTTVNTYIDGGYSSLNVYQDYRVDTDSGAFSLWNETEHKDFLQSLEAESYSLGKIEPSSSGSGPVPAGYPTELSYNPEGQMNYAVIDDVKYSYTDGALVSAANVISGEVLDISTNADLSVLGNITNVSLNNGDIQSVYDENGRLASVQYDGVTVHYKKDAQEISFIETAGGNEIYNPVFGENGEIESAEIYDSQGNLRIYNNGALERLVRDTGDAYYFDADSGDILSWLTPDGLEYEFMAPDSSGIIEAVLNTEEGIEIPSTAVSKYHFDDGYNLKKMIRQNQDIISFTEDSLIDFIDYYVDEEADQYFDYSVEGQVKVTKGNGVTIYDDNNNPIESTIATQGGELYIEYEYGKIRKVFKNSDLIFLYSYSFDDEGNEFTVVNDLQENQTKTYLDKQLLYSEHNETRVKSTYSYDEEGRIQNVAVTRLGRELKSYDYSYEDGLTVVEDQDGVKRYYNSDNDLVRLNRDGYVYEYVKNEARSGALVSYSDDLIAEDSLLLFSPEGWRELSGAEFVNNAEFDGLNRPTAVTTIHNQTFEFTHESETLFSVIHSSGDQLKFSYSIQLDEDGKITQVSRQKAEANYGDPQLVSEGLLPQVTSTDVNDTSTAARITDGEFGDIGAPWTGADATGADEIILDLGEVNDLSHVVYDSRHFLGTDIYQEGYTISISTDGISWNEACVAEGLSEGSAAEIMLDEQVRYIKIHNIRVVNNTDPTALNAYLSEFQVYKQGEVTWSWEDNAAFTSVYDGGGRIESVTKTDAISLNAELTEYLYQEITTEQLVRRQLPDGSEVHYKTGVGEAGDIDRIEYSDGRIIDDVILDQNRTILSATITDASTGIKTLYREGQVIGLVHPDGREFYYDNHQLTGFIDEDRSFFDVVQQRDDQGVLQSATLSKDLIQLHYDAAGNLDSANLMNIDDAANVKEATEHDYEGGYGGRFGVDGDFETAHKDQRRHFSGGYGNIYSTYTFPSEQRLKSLTYKMSAFGEARGEYIRDYSASVAIEALVDGEWIVVEGTQIQRSGNGDGSATIDTGIVTLDNIDLDSVRAIRAYARGFGNASGGEGEANGGAEIYEFQFETADRSHFDISFTDGALTLSSFESEIAFDAQGQYSDQGNPVLDEAAAELIGVAQLMQTLPHTAALTVTAPDDLDDIYSTTAESVLRGDFIFRQEYSEDGVMEVQTKADKTVTLYDDNRPTSVYDEHGKELIRHEYDADGNIQRITMLNARETLPKQMRATRSRIYQERRDSLKQLAEQKGLLTEQIRRDADELRVQVQSHLDYWARKADYVANLEVRGKEAREAVAEALDDLNGAVDQLQGQIDQINRQEADSYAKLDEEVQAASDKIDDDTQIAFIELYRQKQELEREITRQEISPVIYDTYRRLMGRDPTNDEYEFWIDRMDFQTGEIFYDESQADLHAEPLPSSLEFNGEDAKLHVEHSSDLDLGTGDFALDFWANFKDQDRTQTLVDFDKSTGLGVEYRVDTEGNGLIVLTLGGEEYVTQWKPDTSTFHHLAFTREGGIVKMFINGIRVLKVPSENVINENGDEIQYDFDESDRLTEVRVIKNGVETLYTPEGYLKRELLEDGTTRHYAYNFDANGNPTSTRVVERTPVAIGGTLPKYDSETGRFTRFSAHSAGYIDGFTSALYANDKGVGTGSYNYQHASTGERWMGRGIDVAITDADGNLIKSDIFDTWNSSAESERLAEFLESTEPGHYAVMAISDEASRNLTDRAMFAIESFGSSKIRDLEFRASWAMIGRKGAAAGTAIEKMNAQGSGPAKVANYSTTVSYYDADGNPIVSDNALTMPDVTWTSVHGYESHEGFESLGDLPDGRTAGFFKNFNENHMESGFYNLADDANNSDSFLHRYESFIDQVVETTSHARQKVVFYDNRYSATFISATDELYFANQLKDRGFTIVNADELESFMEANGSDAAVVFAHGVIPDNLYDRDLPTHRKTVDKVRPFLERGGTFVWTNNSPFFHSGKADGSEKMIGEVGSKDVLGVTPIYSRGGYIFRDFYEMHDFNAVDEEFQMESITGSMEFSTGNLVISASEEDLAPTQISDNRDSSYTTLPYYKAQFMTGSGDEGFELGLDGRDWGRNRAQLFVRHENGLLNVYSQYHGDPQVVGSITADPNTEYIAEFQIDFKTLRVQLYKAGSPIPQIPLYESSGKEWLDAHFRASVENGNGVIGSVQFRKHAGERISPQTVEAPVNELYGYEQPISIDSLTYDVGTEKTDLSGITTGMFLGGSSNGSDDFFDGYIEEFRLSKGVARFSDHFIRPSERYLPDMYTALLIRSGEAVENIGTPQDYSANPNALQSYGSVGYSTDIYKFEKSFFGGLTDRSHLTFPGPSSYFNGVNGFMAVDNASTRLDVSKDDWSVDFWINPEEIGSDQTIFSTGFDDQNGATLALGADGRLTYKAFEGGASVVSLESSLDINASEWTHVALAKEDFEYRLYINGEKTDVVAAETDLTFSGEDFQIGRNGLIDDPNKLYYKGYLDEFRFSHITRYSYDFTPYRNEHTNMWGTSFVLRESLFSENVFNDGGWYGHQIEFEDGVFPEDNVSPLTRPSTRDLKESVTEYLEGSQELYQRTQYVDAIKTDVTDQLDEMINLYFEKDDEGNAVESATITDAGKSAMAQRYGMDVSRVIDLTVKDLIKIREYIESRSLHFGQSAFLSLESLLDQKGIHYAREDLATHAIMIDVLAGIISPLDDGDLVLSMYALQTVAEAGIIGDASADLTAMNLSWDDLLAIFEADENAKVVAHISGNHYVIITGITEDSITYVDPGIGKDKENEILTITKDGFLGEWEGNVLTHHNTSTVILSEVEGSREALLEGSIARELSIEETQSIRGAFWGSMLSVLASIVAIALAIPSGGTSLTIAGFLNAMGTAMISPAVIGLRIGSIVASMVEGDWTQAVSSAVQIGLSFGFADGGFLQGMFKGVGDFLGNLGGAFSSIFEPISGFIAPVFNGLKEVFGFVPGVTSLKLAELSSFVIGAGVSYGVSKGLTALGVDPQIAGIASSFISGGITAGMDGGALTSQTNALSVEQTMTLNLYNELTFNDVGRLGQDLGWDAGFTNVLGYSLSAIQGVALNPNYTPDTLLEDAFKDVRADIFGSFAEYGLYRFSESLGIDPRISGIIGLPIAGAIGRSFDAGRIVGEDLIQSVIDGLTGGAIQLGLDFAIDELDIDNPLLESLASTALTRTVSTFLDPNGNLIEDLLKSAGDFTEEFLGEITSTEFIVHASQYGFESALEAYATNIFSRQALEEIHGVGGISQIISGRSELIDFNGITLTKVNVTGSEGFILDGNGAFIGTVRTVNGIQQASIGQFDIGSGKSKLINGTIRQVHPNGEVSYIEVRGGKAYRLALKMPDANDPTPQATVIEVTCEGGEGTCYRFDFAEGQQAEPIWDWEVVENYNGELTINGFDIIDGLHFINGEATYNITDYFADSLFNNYKESQTIVGGSGPLTYDGDVDYLLLNGIRGETVPEGTYAGYFNPNNANSFVGTLGNEGVDTNKVDSVALFEDQYFFATNPLNFTFLGIAMKSMGFDLGELVDLAYDGLVDVLFGAMFGMKDSREIKAELDNIHQNQTDNYVPVGYSGGGRPLLQRLNADVNGSYISGVLGEYYNVESVILVGAPVVPTKVNSHNNIDRIINIYGDDDKLKPFINKNFDGVETINIELTGGIGHTDYFYNPEKDKADANNDGTITAQEQVDFDARMQKVLAADAFIARMSSFADEPDALEAFLGLLPKVNNTYTVDVVAWANGNRSLTNELMSYNYLKARKGI